MRKERKRKERGKRERERMRNSNMKEREQENDPKSVVEVEQKERGDFFLSNGRLSAIPCLIEDLMLGEVN